MEASHNLRWRSGAPRPSKLDVRVTINCDGPLTLQLQVRSSAWLALAVLARGSPGGALHGAPHPHRVVQRSAVS